MWWKWIACANSLEGNELSSIPTNHTLREHLKKSDRSELKKQFNAINPKLKKKLDSSSVKRLIRALEIDDYLKSNPYPKLPKTDIAPIIIGIDISREERRRKISIRLKDRLENGMIEEVQELLKSVSNEDLKYYGLEYLFVTEYLEGQYDFNELFRKLEIAIHQFSKRQMTWFRKMEKDGYRIHWIEAHLTTEEKTQRIVSVL